MGKPKQPTPKEQRKRIEEFLKPFRVTTGKGFRLSKMKPADTRGVKSKKQAQLACTRRALLSPIQQTMRVLDLPPRPRPA